LSAARIDPHRVHFIMGLMGVELNTAIADLDICVIPSLCNEIGPLTMLEAMAQRVPCIASDCMGMSHLIRDGKNGRLFPVGNKEALVGILDELLRNPQMATDWRKSLPPDIDNEKEYTRKLMTILEDVCKLHAARHFSATANLINTSPL